MDDGSGTLHGPIATDFEEVALLLRRDIDPADRSFFQAELDRAAPYVEDRSGPLLARIQMAMLFVAQADRDEIVAARELADIDWRDLLSNAEHSGDWQAIHRWRRGRL